MQHNSTRTSSAVLGRTLAMTLIAAAVLSACGGGGGDPGTTGPGAGNTGTTPTTPTTPTPTTPTTPTTPPPTPTVALKTLTIEGKDSNSLTGATPLKVEAVVKDANNKPVANALVTFATDPTLVQFSPSSGTALTGPDGVASVTMRAASLTADGAAKLTVTSTVDGVTTTSETNYKVGATALTFGTIALTSNSITAYDSTVLSVELLAAGQRYQPQVNVNFSSACVAAGKATLAKTVPTNNGVTQTVYRDQGCANDDVITITSDGVSAPATASLKIAPPSAASVQFMTASPTDKSIVIRGQGGINRTETATLKFRVFDTFGNPLPRRLVNFTVSSPNVTLNKLSDSTDEKGEVITTVNSGDVATSFRVTATLPNTATASHGDISTSSDSIVVTTGLPVQNAFSLSAGKFNLEARSESGPTNPATHIQSMIADAYHNPVPDGTPVVFQTNMGSIGSADKGGCSTINGGCQVDFRMQDPRVATPGQPATPCNSTGKSGITPDSTRAGVATVCASTTDGVNTIYGKIALFFSGSVASNIYMDNATTPLDGSVVDLGTVSSQAPRVFLLQFNDQNKNPMPFGSKVEVTSMMNGAGTVIPATVPNIAPHNTSGDDPTGNSISDRQGSWHTFSISNPEGIECKGPRTASFNATITTPAGIVTSIPFKLAFSCP